MNARGSPEELDLLFTEYARTRRRRDRNALVEAHLGFANHLAYRYRDRGIPTEDLRQTAMLALIKAVDRYDPDMGSAFTSFAGPTIEGEIKRMFRDTAWSVRVPRSVKELHLQVRSATDALTTNLGRSPTVPEVARELGASVDQVVEAMAAGAAFHPQSLDSPGSNGNPLTGSATEEATQGNDLEAADARLTVESLIAVLPEREQEIVRLRFTDELTQAEIAERIGVSQMHVSRLLRKSFAIMRRRAAADPTDRRTPDR